MKQTILIALKLAIEMLYKNDVKIFDSKNHIGERNLTFRLGHYLANILEQCFPQYNLDCEYNRNGENIKTLCSRGNVVPDIIFHKWLDTSKENNILIIEVKGHWGNENEKADDIARIKEFCDPCGEYAYKFGFFLVLGKTLDDCQIKYYENGNLLIDKSYNNFFGNLLV